MNRNSLSAIIAVLLLSLSSGPAFGQDTVTRTGVLFRVGKALNHAFVAEPKPRHNYLGMADRSHYATNVYAYEGLATANHDVNTSRGVFIHFDFGQSSSREVKLGHSLAE